MAFSGQATGFLEAGAFKGTVEAKYEGTFPAMPALRITLYGSGQIEFSVIR
jgi:hypothetical protein